MTSVFSASPTLTQGGAPLGDAGPRGQLADSRRRSAAWTPKEPSARAPAARGIGALALSSGLQTTAVYRMAVITERTALRAIIRTLNPRLGRYVEAASRRTKSCIRARESCWRPVITRADEQEGEKDDEKDDRDRPEGAPDDEDGENTSILLTSEVDAQLADQMTSADGRNSIMQNRREPLNAALSTACRPLPGKRHRGRAAYTTPSSGSSTAPSGRRPASRRWGTRSPEEVRCRRISVDSYEVVFQQLP
jgi:hypothetical protein